MLKMPCVESDLCGECVCATLCGGVCGECRVEGVLYVEISVREEVHLWRVPCMVSAVCGEFRVWRVPCVVSALFGECRLWGVPCVESALCGECRVW